MSLVDVLEVDVLEARNLAPKDDGVSSDPYCTVEIRSQDQAILRQKKATKVIDKTLNPKWNAINLVGGQEFLPPSTTAYVLLECFDKDVMADDFEGMVEIPVLSVLEAPNKLLDQWFPLRPHAGKEKTQHVSGDVHLVLRVTKQPLRMEKGKRVTRFMKLLLNDCMQEVLDLFHPELKSYIDSPLLRQWALYHRETLGLIRNRRPIIVSSTTDKNMHITTSKEVVRLERGAIEYELKWLDQQIVAFNLSCSEVAPFVWLNQIPVGTFCERGLAFLRLATSSATIKEAWAEMHVGLRRVLATEEVALGLSSKAQSTLGAWQSGELADKTILNQQQGPTSHDGLVPKLSITYRSHWERGTSNSFVTFAFDKFRAQVIGYSLVSKEAKGL